MKGNPCSYPCLQEKGTKSPAEKGGPSATLLGEAVVSPYCTPVEMSLHPPSEWSNITSFYSNSVPILETKLEFVEEQPASTGYTTGFNRL